MNELDVATSKDLAAIDDMLAEEGSKLANAAVSMPRISTRGGRFTFPDGEVVTGPMEMVILSGRVHKTLWNIPYSEDRGNQEIGIICSAVSDSSLDRNNLVPFASAPLPASTKCSGCPENHWVDEGKSRKKVGTCSDSFRFAVMKPDGIDMQVYILDVSATSITEACKLIHAMKRAYPPHPLKGVAVFEHVPTKRGAPRVSVRDARKPNSFYEAHAAQLKIANAMVEAEPRWFSPEKQVEGEVVADVPPAAAQPSKSGKASRSSV